MKIAVYSICRNEIDQVDSYLDHLDKLGLKPYVLDHSTDGTTERLRARGAVVDTKPIQDWWWDRGKNAAMLSCPKADWYVNIDIDERLAENFWEIMEKVAKIAEEDFRYDLVQHLYKPEGGKDRVRYDWRLHKGRVDSGTMWKGPVHEYIESHGKLLKIDELLITHWPPPGKNHVPVETVLRAVKAFPDDVRIKALCGRELFFSQRYEEATQQLRAFLRRGGEYHDNANYAHRLLGKCYEKLAQPERALNHFRKAAESGKREALVDLAYAYNSREMYLESYAAARQALDVTAPGYYPDWDADAWTWKPHEMISVALYYHGQYNTALLAAETALSAATDEKVIARLTDHIENIKATMNEKAAAQKV